MAGTYRKPTREEGEAYIHMDVEAFGGEPDRWIKALDKYLPTVRIVEMDGEVAGGLIYFPVGQWFSGGRVPGWAIGGVVTSPRFRGRGVGRTLMLGMLREAREQGVPLSVLYASTPTFYRRCGYEPAGYAYSWSCESQYLPRTPVDPTMSIHPFEPDDPQVVACYNAWASTCNGTLDRDEWMWQHAVKPIEGKRFRYRFDFDGQTEGYVSLSGDRRDGLGMADHAATTLRARQAILTFLHDHRSVNGKVMWNGGINDPLCRLIPENRAQRRKSTEQWLLRLADVEAALRQRGYRKVSGELHVDIADVAMPENAGPYVLALDAGEPRVERGGDGRLKLDIRGLTAIYTGQATAEEMAAAGLAEGDGDALALASLVFGGPQPFMVDRF